MPPPVASTVENPTSVRVCARVCSCVCVSHTRRSRAPIITDHTQRVNADRRFARASFAPIATRHSCRSHATHTHIQSSSRDARHIRHASLIYFITRRACECDAHDPPRSVNARSTAPESGVSDVKSPTSGNVGVTRCDINSPSDWKRNRIFLQQNLKSVTGFFPVPPQRRL